MRKKLIDKISKLKPRSCMFITMQLWNENTKEPPSLFLLREQEREYSKLYKRIYATKCFENMYCIIRFK